jgi:hypothetical protein
MSVDPHEAERELRGEPKPETRRDPQDGESRGPGGRVRPVPPHVDPRPERDRGE